MGGQRRWRVVGRNQGVPVRSGPILSWLQRHGGGEGLVDVLDGRAAATFVILAGIGASLGSRTAREGGPPPPPPSPGLRPGVRPVGKLES